LLNNQTGPVYDCVKPLSQRAIKEISQGLREVSISMSKPQQWACFNDTHRQCDDPPTLIVLLTSESIRLPVHVQLVSLLQWHDNAFDNKQIFELVSISKPQWVCFNDILNAMIYPLSSPYLPVNLTRHRVHVQLVSLLQWHLPSMQWSSYSHRSTNQWIGLSTRSRANSEPATKTSFVNAMIYLLTSLYLSVNLVKCPHATSESASMARSMRWSTHSHRPIHQWTWSYVHVQLVSLLQWHHSISHSEPATIGISILHKAKEIHSCEHESLKKRSNVTILATHLCW